MAYMTVSIASGMVDSMYGNCQYPIKSYLIKRGEELEQVSILKKLVREQKSDSWAEGYSGETAMDDFEPVGEGGAYPTTGFEEGYRKAIENETWKQSFSVTQELVEDHKIGEMKQRANKLVTSYNRTREMFVRSLYAGALKGDEVQIGTKKFSTTSADGQRLFSKTHKNKVDGKTQTNMYAGDFDVTALDKISTNMQNTVGDNGELLAIVPDTIWIPNDAALKRKVFAAIGADKFPADNTNAWNYQFGQWNVLVDPYLNIALKRLGVTQMPFFLMDSSFIQQNDGPILQNRVPLNVTSKMDENNDNNVWKGRARFSGGFVDWRFIAGGNISGGTSLA